MMVTKEEIEQARTPAGGFTKDQLAQWGVPWPPPKGWKKALVEGKTLSRSSRADPTTLIRAGRKPVSERNRTMANSQKIIDGLNDAIEIAKGNKSGLVTIKQTRGPTLRFKGELIASDRSGPVHMEIWQTKGGALIPVTSGEMRGREDVRAEVVEPVVSETPVLEPDNGDGVRHVIPGALEMDNQAMRLAVMDFFDWDNRARSMVRKQLKWKLVREIA